MNDWSRLLWKLVNTDLAVNFEELREGTPTAYARLVTVVAHFREFLMKADLSDLTPEQRESLAHLEDCVIKIIPLLEKWLRGLKFFLYTKPDATYIEQLKAAYGGLLCAGRSVVGELYPEMAGFCKW